MNKWFSIIFGLFLFSIIVFFGWASSAYSYFLFGKNFDFLNSAWIFLKGGIFWLLLMISIVLIILGIIDLKE